MQNIKMRVVGGQYSRRHIIYDGDKDIRPTKDIVRQGIFNALGHDVVGKRVLDLFAGTGALGIEALSRGAEAVTLVDQSSAAIKLIKTNTSYIEKGVDIVRQDYSSFIQRATKQSYDLLFLDPPYHLDVKAILEAVDTAQLLKPSAIVVLESDKPLAFFIESGKIKSYKYGITHVTIWWRNI